MTHYLHNNKLYEIDRMPPDDDFHWALCDCDGCGDLRKEWHSFNIYLSTLTPIPHELKGEGIQVEGKDFEWRYECKGNPENGGNVWGECAQKVYERSKPELRRRVAVPIEAKEQAVATPHRQPAKETMLEQLADLLKKYDVRKYLNLNDSGYSQVERDIVDLFAPQQQAGREDYWKGFDDALELVVDMYGSVIHHPFNIADCVKAKVNRLPTDQVRPAGPSSVSNPVAFGEWLRTFGPLTKENGYWVIESQVSTERLYTLFTSQHGEQETQEEIWDQAYQSIRKYLNFTSAMGIRILSENFFITPKKTAS